LILTKGIEQCVWLLPPDQWERVSVAFLSTTSLSLKKSNLIHHRFIVPAQEIEIDRVGRVAVPQSLREFAGLSKDCVVLGKGKSIEIWDAERYQSFLELNDDLLKEVLEESVPFTLF
jgi:MraZ protein